MDFNGKTESFEAKVLYFDMEKEEGAISIFPIPAKDKLTISIPEVGVGELLIKNQMGVLIMKQNLISGINHVSISELESGNYYISLIMDSKIIHKKNILL